MHNQKHQHPPKWADKFLEWRMGIDNSEEVIGDMHELFKEWVFNLGAGSAKRKYILNALGFLRPLPKQLRKGTNKHDQNILPFIRTFMWSNFVKMGWRNMLRSKVNTTINVTGLTLGLTCCLVLFLIIKYETSFDKHHSKAGRIYRVNTKFITSEGGYTANAPIPLGKALKESFGEIEEVTTTELEGADPLIKVNDKIFKQKGVAYIAPSFFLIFDAKWLSGSPKVSLSSPNSVVLTKSVAEKYFGVTNPFDPNIALGKTILLKSQYQLQVTGIIDDFPPTTDLPFEVLVSYASLPAQTNQDLNSWANIASSYSHFVLLKKGIDPRWLEAKIPSILKKYRVDKETKHVYLLQPLIEMHSDERFGNYTGKFMPKENINSLVLIGTFILLIASINFINLSTAQSVRRSKEVGIRKVIGSLRHHIIFQFLGETLLLCVISIVLSILITYYALPPLNNFLDAKISLRLFSDPAILAFLLGITSTVTLLAGFYPAFVVSGLKPILALKNKITMPASGALTLRRGLIVTQFIIAQLLIIGTLVIFNQLKLFHSKPLGYNKEGVITIEIPEGIDKAKRDAYRTRILQIPGVKNISFSLTPPSTSDTWSAGFNYSGSGLKDDIGCLMYPVDEHYLDTYSIELLAGRGLRKGDSSSVVVNETVLQKLNIRTAQEAIGMKIIIFDNPVSIVGVVKNFNTQSFKKATDPVIMLYKDWVFVGGVKIGLENIKVTVDRIGEVWKEMFPESLFEYNFLEDRLARFYIKEVKVFKLLRTFSAIAILISCLGLYGLVSFMAVQRTKEIGIRKVLGATTSHIVNLFAKEFVVLILIAFLIAAPIAWYALHAWLANYENKTHVGITSFLFALTFSLILAGCTIFYRSLRAALANTVENIKAE